MKKTSLAVLLFAFCAGTTTQAQTKTGIHLLHTYKVGSNGNWDYLLADHQQLYVSHGTQVNILNESTGDSTGVIANTPGVHGIALVPTLKKGYTSNGKSGECTVFDLTTHTALTTIKTGDNPDAIFYDDFSGKVIVFNGRSFTASVIDPKKDLVIATVPLGGKPETGVSDGKGNIYVNIENTNEVVCFSAKTFKVTKRFKLKGGDEPSGLAIDRINSRLFVGCGNKKMLVLDAHTGKQISVLPIGEGSDGITFDPQLKLIYSSNMEGTLTVIKAVNTNQYRVLENVKTTYGARTIALDQITHHIFLPTADFKSAGGKNQPRVPGTFRIMEYGKS